MKTDRYNQKNELGKVSWYRDYEEAIDLSQKSNKPVLLFFQEIPGCSTCVNYGKDVLSFPLMAEIIENEFIPLAIYNNKPGKDAEVLKTFNEPSWNNPVTYFVDEKGKSIVGKLSNNYSPFGLYIKLVEVLTKLNKPIPEYAKLLYRDLKINFGFTQKGVFETPCFWSGETTLAQHPAIYSTIPGFYGNREVVEFEYDSKLITLKELDEFAKEQGFYIIDGNQKFRVDKDPQYYLKKTNFRFLALSNSQKSIINSSIPYQINPVTFLSPKQLCWYNHKKITELSHPQTYTLPIEQSWEVLDNIHFKEKC